ncbi:MAG: bile acid:sodium symporter [Xanthomonadales bacterium]|nr:bile acid:sodium symporter [Xanthomonadales bacterium]
MQRIHFNLKLGVLPTPVLVQLRLDEREASFSRRDSILRIIRNWRCPSLPVTFWGSIPGSRWAGTPPQPAGSDRSRHRRPLITSASAHRSSKDLAHAASGLTGCSVRHRQRDPPGDFSHSLHRTSQPCPGICCAEDRALLIVFCGSKKSLASGIPIATCCLPGNPALGMIVLAGVDLPI